MNCRISRYGFEQLKAAMPAVRIDWSEPNRTAAEQVLALGGTVEIGAPGKEARLIKQGDSLPREFFQVRRILLRDVQKPLGDLPQTLALLSFAEFDRLEVIDLSGTSLQDLGFLAPIHGLQEAILVKTGIRDSHLAQLPKLKRLMVDGNSLGALENLAKQSELTELSLAGVGLADENLARLPKLPKLRRLVVDGNAIRGPGLVHLLDQPELIDLSLAGCPTLTDLGVKNLAGLKQLKRLSLASSAVTDAGLRHLEGLTKLEELDLRGTKVTAAGIAALRKAKHKCKIVWEGNKDK